MRRLLLSLLLLGCHGESVESPSSDDSGVDSTSVDSSLDAADTGRDAVSEAPFDGDASSCPPPMIFCSGFEAAPTAEWDSLSEVGGGTIRLGATAHSGAFALLTTLPLGATKGVRAVVSKAFSLTPTNRTVAVTAWVRLDAVTSNVDLVLLRLAGDATGHGASLLLDSGGLAVVTWGAAIKKTPITTTPAPKTWFKVVLEAGLDPSPSRVRLFLGSSVVFDDSTGTTAVSGAITPRLELGVDTTVPTTTTSQTVVHYDDVTIEPR